MPFFDRFFVDHAQPAVGRPTDRSDISALREMRYFPCRRIFPHILPLTPLPAETRFALCQRCPFLPSSQPLVQETAGRRSRVEFFWARRRGSTSPLSRSNPAYERTGLLVAATIWPLFPFWTNAINSVSPAVMPCGHRTDPSPAPPVATGELVIFRTICT